MTSLNDAARAFLASAFDVLHGENVLPTPEFDPFLRIGPDYFGSSLMGLGEFAAFEDSVAERHPRFSADAPINERGYAHDYLFSFLEAVVAKAALGGEDPSPDASCVDSCLEALVSEIEAEVWEVACCREVTHLTTATGQPLELSDVVVIPLTAPPYEHSSEADRIISEIIPHSQSAYGRTSPGTWNPPHAIAVARDYDSKPFEAAKALSRQIDDFLLATRLLHAATCDSVYEIQGETSIVRRFDPTFVRFRGNTASMIPTSMLRRTTRLEQRDVKRCHGLSSAIAAAEETADGMLITSFSMAVHKFQISFHAHNWHEQIVDLTIALEATLSGISRTGVLRRLKTRASALLATPSDPAEAISRDIGILYDIRSRLIHGGPILEEELVTKARKLTTVPDSLPAIAVDHAVDRLRDLVRRALLARISLATCEPPLWKFGEDREVDAHLADDASKAKWRSTWHSVLMSFDAEGSVERPRTAAEFTSQNDL